MPGYQYRGAVFDAKPKAAMCGTRSGYQAHKDKGDPACEPCKKANAAYTNDWERRRRKRTVIAFDPGKCGTMAGYGSHKYYGIPVCDACQEATSAYHKAYKAARKAAA